MRRCGLWIACADFLSLSLSASFDVQALRTALREDVKEELQQIRHDQQEMKERLALAISVSMSSPSTADLGRRVWDGCQLRADGIADSVSAMAPAAILAVATYEGLVNKFDANPGAQLPGTKEHVWVALVTPTLMQLLRAHLRQKLLVNSELVPWIRTESNLPDYFQKPDLFICDEVAFLTGNRPLVKETSSASSKYADSLRDASFLFGSCAWPLRDAVHCLLEAKVKISLHDNIGEVFPKIQNLLRHSHRASQKCCLFDMHTIHLLTFTSTGLQSSHRFAWTAPGSVHTLIDFISPRGMLDPVWLHCLRHLCTQFHAHPVLGQAFLGTGAHGKVFRVRRAEAAAAAVSSSSAAAAPPSLLPSTLSSTSSPPSVESLSTYALKIVDRVHLDSLDAERLKLHTILSRAKLAGSAATAAAVLPTFVSDVKRVTTSDGDPVGAGLLLAPVGAPLSVWKDSTRPSNKAAQALLSDVFDALLQLHRAGITHGDARLENVVRVAQGGGDGDGGSQVVWIDFRVSAIESSIEEQQWWDFRSCLKSFFNHYHRTLDREPDWHTLRDSYHNVVSLGGSLPRLVQAAWAAVSQAP